MTLLDLFLGKLYFKLIWYSMFLWKALNSPVDWISSSAVCSPWFQSQRCPWSCCTDMSLALLLLWRTEWTSTTRTTSVDPGQVLGRSVESQRGRMNCKTLTPVLRVCPELYVWPMDLAPSWSRLALLWVSRQVQALSRHAFLLTVSWMGRFGWL
jgi:hypothetical protein